MSELLRVERETPRAGVWRLVLDDPAHANALSAPLVRRLAASLHAAFDDGARVVILDSSGKHFCAGFDLRDVDAVSDVALRERFGEIEDLLETLRRAPALTMVIVRGAARGAGADLVACCDYRIGTSGASLAFPGSRFGVVLGTRHLAGVIGRQAAREILIEGKTLDAKAAVECGLLSELCAEETLAARVDEILQRSDGIDAPTLQAILRLTRDAPSARDRADLSQSTWRGSLAERLRDHVRRSRDARAARGASRE